ncbi:unnamed protein product, partial [Meganyctiphanes norvegica]
MNVKKKPPRVSWLEKDGPGRLSFCRPCRKYPSQKPREGGDLLSGKGILMKKKHQKQNYKKLIAKHEKKHYHKQSVYANDQDTILVNSPVINQLVEQQEAPAGSEEDSIENDELIRQHTEVWDEINEREDEFIEDNREDESRAMREVEFEEDEARAMEEESMPIGVDEDGETDDAIYEEAGDSVGEIMDPNNDMVDKGKFAPVRSVFIKKGRLTPLANFPFQKYGKTNRRFRSTYFTKYPWTSYYLDRVWCYACVLYKKIK